MNHIDISSDWGTQLAAIPALGDVKPWRLAVVLDASEAQARIGLQPPREKSGEVARERETGVLPVDGMRWAGRGVRGTLTPGDVVYVEPMQGHAGQYRLRQIPEISGAMVAMDPYTGRIFSMVGGFSFDQSEFNRATQALRQPGSSFKPFVYAAALDGGYTPSSQILDEPISIVQADGTMWTPENFEGGHGSGAHPLRYGVEHSKNMMTVRLAKDVGLDDGDRLVENLRGGGVAAVERGRVDEGLEGRTRLSQRLRRPVELGLVERKAPNHGEDAPGIGVHRHHGAGNLGDLAQAVLSGVALHGLDIDDIAGRERAAHAATGPAHAVDRQNAGLALARHLAGFFARRLQTDASLRLAGVEHHREPPRFHVAERRNRRQLRSPIGRNVDVIHSPAKAVRLVKSHQAIRQRLARERLNFWIERGADGQTAFIELLLAVTIEQFAPQINLDGNVVHYAVPPSQANPNGWLNGGNKASSARVRALLW